jgi:hypothetical protein
MQFAQNSMSPAGAVQVIDVPAVFTVNSYRGSREQRRKQSIQSSHIACVYYVRLQMPESFVEAPQCRNVSSRFLFYCDYFDIIPINTPTKVGKRIDTNNCVPISVPRQPVYQVDEAVFQPPNIETKDNVCN